MPRLTMPRALNRVVMYAPPDGRLPAEEFEAVGTGYHRVTWQDRAHLILVLPGGHFRTLY